MLKLSYPGLLVALLVSGVSASDASDTANWSNWHWSVVVKEELAPDLDTLVRLSPQSEEKTQQTVDEFCAKLKVEIAKCIDASFYDNPPFGGYLVITLTLKRKINWEVPQPASGNRAADVTGSLFRTGHFPKSEEDHELSKTPGDKIRGKGKDYEVVNATVDLIDPISNRTVTFERHGLSAEEFAQVISTEMARIAAGKKESDAAKSE